MALILVKHPNNQGFSLLQMLIAISISSIVIAGLASAMSAHSKGMALQSSKLGQMVLAQDIRSEISTNARCTAVLAGPTGKYRPGKDNRAKIRVVFSTGQEVQENQDLSAYNIYVESLEFVRTATPTNLGGGRQAHFGEIEMKTSGGASNSFDFKAVKLGKLELITDSRGRIESCGTTSDAVAEVCNSVGGSLEGTRCKLPTPTCVPRTGTWTWCGSSCPNNQAITPNGEKWRLMNMVGGPQQNSGCRWNRSVTCRYEITCPNGSFQ